jgi:hypothetical protein
VTDDATRILQEALELDANERAALAAELLVSLDDADEDVQKAWASEIERRSKLALTERGDDWRAVLNDIRANVLER